MKEGTGAVQLQLPVDVATFLLNEKRHDILAVEARHRVEVILIPNMHFETPRYTLTRLRHDQLNQAEPMAPSYRMVEKPQEEEAPGKAGNGAKPERPQAAVQGITPPAPAPSPAPAAPAAMATAEAAKPGLFGRIVSWLRGVNPPPVEAAKPVEEKKAEPRRERDSRRRDSRESRDNRGERRERPPRGERSERPEKGEGAERAARGERQENRGERRERAERPDRTERQERPRRERPERAERPERVERPPQAPAEVEIQPPQAEAEIMAEGGDERESRTRGSRNRRGSRGRRGEGRGEGAEGQTAMELETAAGVPESASPVTPSASEQAPVQTSLAEAPAVEAAPADIPSMTPPPVKPNLEAAGLQMVETHAADAQPVATEEATPAQQAPSRRRRARRTGGEAADAAEPLVMVETASSAPGEHAEQPAEWGPPSNPRRRARPKVETAQAEGLVLVETRHEESTPET